MFKKIFISSFLVLSMLGFYRASAFLDKSVGGAYTGSVTYSGLHVVSAGDFADTIYFEATSSPNTILNLVGNFGSGFQPLSPNSTITTDANGLAHTYANYTWPEEDLSSEYTYQAQFRASDNSDNQSSIAYYKAKVSYASINMSNNKSITQNANVPKGTKVTFSCSGASEMYFGATNNWPGNAPLVASDYGPHTNTGDYALSYTIILNTNGNFRLECDNIGGTNTRKRLNFTVYVNCPDGQVADTNGYCHAPCPTGTVWDADTKQCVEDSTSVFNIVNIVSNPNIVQTANTFGWYSGGDICNFNTENKNTKLANGSLPAEGVDVKELSY